MKIVLDKVSKRFNQNWLFKELDYQFTFGSSYAITGANGTGKTTLLKIISGMIPCSKGTIDHFLDDKKLEPDHLYKYLSFVAPYMEIPEELSFNEFLKFHFTLKRKIKGYSIPDIALSAGLSHAAHKPLHTFSSGMKQRAKLAMGFFSETPVLLLDEPTTNLDLAGTQWYRQEMKKLRPDKLLIISSNQTSEYDFCDHVISL
ncbi:MAG: heme ABC exporter ATP-binding protein CcmA [Cyclobacteriaceae bacterium]|nr:MAG: heme ABC exporter ATP-binding protein CcmA [Cyclobacteriaceae bacterium]